MRLFFVGLFLLFSNGILNAHPASDMLIDYDLEKSEIYVVILHKVKDPNDHYISKVEVSLNGKKIITQHIQKQIDAEKQRVVYLIPGLKEGDKILVWVECNKFGTYRKEITIAKKN